MNQKPIVLPVPTIIASVQLGFQIHADGTSERVPIKPAIVIPIDSKRVKPSPDVRREIITRALCTLSPETVRSMMTTFTTLKAGHKLSTEDALPLRLFVVAVTHECRQAGLGIDAVLNLGRRLKEPDGQPAGNGPQGASAVKVDFPGPPGDEAGTSETLPSHNSLACGPKQSDESSCAEAQKAERTTNMTNSEATSTEITAAVADKGAHVAPEKGSSTKRAHPKKAAPKGQKTGKGGKSEAAATSKPKKAAPGKKTAAKAPAKTAKAETAGPREGSKTAQVVAMLQRKNGATLAEIMDKMGWLKHTVRGFMAGAMKKAGYEVESFKSDKGERTYRIND